MIAPLEPLQSRPARSTGIVVDHIGIVVSDLAQEVAAWRALGFTVSDPVQLMGLDGQGQSVPLGQASAHVVFENAYIELSSPVPNSGNHLEPYLAHGDGVRIIVLATDDVDASRAVETSSVSDTPAVRDAARTVTIADVTHRARFRWFPLAFDVVPGVLSAFVQHMTPEVVFHPIFINHANGLCRVDRFLASGMAVQLAPPPEQSADGRSPQLHLAPSDHPLVIDAVALSAPDIPERIFRLTESR